MAYLRTVRTEHGEMTVRVDLDIHSNSTTIVTTANGTSFALHDDEAFDLAIELLLAAGCDDSAKAATEAARSDMPVVCERCGKATMDPDLWDPEADTGRVFCGHCWDHRDDPPTEDELAGARMSNYMTFGRYTVASR